MTNGSRVLLAGDAAARPAGLERALTRAGFQLAEARPTGDGPEPDATLVTLPNASAEAGSARPCHLLITADAGTVRSGPAPSKFRANTSTSPKITMT